MYRIPVWLCLNDHPQHEGMVPIFMGCDVKRHGGSSRACDVISRVSVPSQMKVRQSRFPWRASPSQVSMVSVCSLRRRRGL